MLWNLFELTWQQPPVRFRGARASDARPGFRAELERRVLRVPQRRRRPLHAAASLALIQELVDAARNAGAAQAYVVDAYGLAVDGTAHVARLEMIDHQIVVGFAEEANRLPARGAQANVDAIPATAVVRRGQLHNAGTAVHRIAALLATARHQQLLRGKKLRTADKTVHWMV